MPRRPSQLPKRPALSAEQIEVARYVGSPEHKVKRWWGGLPKAFADVTGVATRPDREDTTICQLNTEADRDEATRWVQRALKAGQFSFYEGDKDYPRKIWYKEDVSGQIWFGQCVNSVRGEYKGWPIDEEERHEIFR
jgi:hypothetical protein